MSTHGCGWRAWALGVRASVCGILRPLKVYSGILSLQVSLTAALTPGVQTLPSFTSCSGLYPSFFLFNCQTRQDTKPAQRRYGLNTTALTLSGRQQEFQELASLLGHELRNPLAVIIGNASFLLGRTPPAAATEPLMDIRREGERALAIINAFLEVDAANSSELASLPAACRKIRGDFMRWSPGRRIDIQVSDELPAARAMQVQVEEVLQNLVSNADKYSPSGQPIRIGYLCKRRSASGLRHPRRARHSFG